MDLQAIKDALGGIGDPVYVGFAPSNAKVPYVVLRPLILDLGDEGPAIAGNAITWDNQVSAYCAGGSVEASFNLAKAVMGALQGVRVADYVLSTSMGYDGAPVEGHYEAQVTIQNNQGGI
ncbi:tail terminator [Microbacterium phage Juanyo]|nr:tail terminator [Microbacterium phage Juanyo]